MRRNKKQQKLVIASIALVGVFLLSTVLFTYAASREESNEITNSEAADNGENPNNHPVCDGITINPSVVEELTTPIEIKINASDADGLPSKVIAYVAAANQGEPNSSFDCVPSPTSAENYSYYCNGENVFKEIDMVENAEELVINTTFEELKETLSSGGIDIDVEETGIYVTANVFNDSDGNLCSSNIARNSGNGVLWDNGDWNRACEGGCNAEVILTKEPEEPPDDPDDPPDKKKPGSPKEIPDNPDPDTPDEDPDPPDRDQPTDNDTNNPSYDSDYQDPYAPSQQNQPVYVNNEGLPDSGIEDFLPFFGGVLLLVIGVSGMYIQKYSQRKQISKNNNSKMTKKV